jgi:hypothetical protein
MAQYNKVQSFWGLSVVFLSLLAETIALYYNFFNSLYSFQQILIILRMAPDQNPPGESGP